VDVWIISPRPLQIIETLRIL